MLGTALLMRWQRKRNILKQRTSHVSETIQAYRQAEERVLILGAGFGGLSTALWLESCQQADERRSVLVVDRNNGLLFSPLLWTVANGQVNPNHVVVPLRHFQKGRHFHLLHAEVENIDLEHQMVQTSAEAYPYDILVIALGSHTNVPDLPGLREHALVFHSPADALQLRSNLIDAIEAAHRAESPEEQQAWLTFVVGGAGDTGVELAATIRDYITTGLFGEYPWLKYPWLKNAHLRVILVSRSERIMPMSEPKTSRVIQRTLEKQGIEVLVGTSVKAVTGRTVETSAGSIPARTFFWAAGITAPDVLARLPVQHARNDAIIVDEHLRIPDYPQVYVIGDSAWAYDAKTGAPIPATAQAAREQGRYVSETITKQLAGRPQRPFRYLPLGHLVLLGRRAAVARIGSLTLTGWVAWMIWHLVYLQRIPSWARRSRLLVDWFLSGLFGRETGQLRLDPGLSSPRRVSRHPDLAGMSSSRGK